MKIGRIDELGPFVSFLVVSIIDAIAVRHERLLHISDITCGNCLVTYIFKGGVGISIAVFRNLTWGIYK